MLTDTKLRALKPRANAYRVADTNGLCIEVRPSGSKAWRYRFRHLGKASIVTLGEYPAMSLAEARDGRDKSRAMVKGGASPAYAAKAERAIRMVKAGNSFLTLALEFIAKREKEGMTAGRVVVPDAGAATMTSDCPARSHPIMYGATTLCMTRWWTGAA